MRRVADDYEQRDPMLHHRAQFVGFVPDATIVRQGNPFPLPDRSKPYLVGAIVREVISVALYGQPCGRQNTWKKGAEVAVGEKDNGQATRS